MAENQYDIEDQVDQEQPPKLKVKDFAAKIKAKYPQYKDVDDFELTNKIVSKFPEYKNQVDFSTDQTPVEKKNQVGNGLQNGLQNGSSLTGFNKYGQPTAQGSIIPEVSEMPFEEQAKRQTTNQLPSTSTAKLTSTDARVGGEAINAEKLEPKTIGKALVKGAESVPSQLLKSVAILSKNLDFFGEYKGKKAEDLQTYKWAKSLDEATTDLVGDLTPEEQNKFQTKVFSGLGQAAGMTVGGLGSRLLRMSEGVAVTGLSASQASAEYENAINSGATPDEASKVFWINGVINSADALPFMAAFRKLDKYTGGLATGQLAKQLASTAEGRITNEIAKSIITGAATNSVQQFLTNVTAKNTYDATRGLFDDVLESGAVGGIITATMTGALSAIREKRAAGDLTKEEDAQLAKAEDFAVKKIEEANINNKKESETETQSEPIKSTQDVPQEKVQDIPTQNKVEEKTQEVDLLKQASEAADTDIKDEIYRNAFKENPEQSLKELSQQLNGNEDESAATRRMFGNKISDIALQLYPNEKVGEQEVKPKVRISAEQLEERQPEKIRERYVDDFNIVEDSKFDWRVTSELSSADRKKAVGDIKAGKDTAAARKLNKEIDDTLERGTVIINRGRGANAETVEIPIDDWFQFTPIEHDRAMKAAEQAPDEVISIIRDNDITLDNIDSLKQLFNGFPYDESDFNNVKTFLQGETTRNAKATSIGEKSNTQEITNEEVIQPSPESPQSIPPKEEGQLNEPTSEIAPPTEPPKEAAVIEGLGDKMIGIKHESTEEVRNRYNLPSYERNNRSDAEIEKEANEQIEKGYNVEKLVKKLEGGEAPTGTENYILAKYLGVLDAEFNRTRSDETLKEIHRVIKATDKIGSLQSEAFRTRKILTPSDESLASFFIREMDAMGVSELTEGQKEKVQNEWDNIEKAKNEFNAYVFQKESEIAGKEIAAKIAEEKSKPTKTRKTDKEFSDERKQIITDIKEKLRKARGETQATILPYAKELIAISPDVAKLVKNLIANGVTKLEDIIDNIHSVLKEDIKDITKKDVNDLIAGVYNEKKQTKNQLAKQLYELRQQAKLVNRLEALLSGEEPSVEKRKIQRNQEIENLRKQIKDVENIEKEIKAKKDAALNLKAEEASKVQEDLSKAETETPENKEAQRLDSYKERTQNQIDALEQKLKKGDYAKEERKPPIKLDAEGRKLKDRLIKLKTEREVRIMKQQYESRSRYDKTKDWVVDKLNIPRTIMSSMDYSAPLRQGIVAGVSHPRTALKAGAEMFRASFSQKNFDRWVFDMRESPRFEDMKKSGLAVTDPHSPFLAAREEQFMNNTAEKIPIVGKLIKGSERAYVMFLNKMRVDLYNRFADRFEEQGKTYDNSPELYKAMSTLINNETGRGNLGIMETAAPVLNTVFFSPRLIASRVNLLTNWANPQWYKVTPKEVRVMYMKDMLKFIGLGATILGLVKLSGGGDDDKDKVTVETDPRSTDFGKIKSGNTRWDIWGGFQQYIRLVAQLATGEKKSATSGEVQELDSKSRFGEARADVINRFVRGKLAPVPSMAVDFFQGRNIVGEEVTLSKEAESHLLPLIYSDVKEAMKDKGVSSLFTVGVPAVFGVGVNTYQVKEPAPKFKVYSKGGSRPVTKEEYKKYNELALKKTNEYLNKYKQSGVYFDKYGEIVLNKKDAKQTKPFTELSEEQLKDLTGKLKSKSAMESREELKLYTKEQIKK